MNNIEVKILNPYVIEDAENLMVAMARMTQRGHKINNMLDLISLFYMPYSKELVKELISLPHPTIQKFGVINIAVVGASRRFLAQITRHQNEVKFMSGSLQYSDYSGLAKFVVPYEIIEQNAIYPESTIMQEYLEFCEKDLVEYEQLVKLVGNDAAAYKLPQSLRNVLLISATPYQLKHMIQQRTCNRNTLETQYIMALIWEQLWPTSEIFHNCGPFCSNKGCQEGKLNCGKPFSKGVTPTELLDSKFKYIRSEVKK